MFLRALKDEQKGLFLVLADKAAKINDIVAEVEEEMLIAYADEMAIPVVVADELSLDDCLAQLKEMSTAKELNQIMYELINLIVCDDEIDDAETAFIGKVADAFAISQDKVDDMIRYAHEHTQLTRKINLLMLG